MHYGAPQCFKEGKWHEVLCFQKSSLCNRVKGVVKGGGKKKKTRSIIQKNDDGCTMIGVEKKTENGNMHTELGGTINVWFNRKDGEAGVVWLPYWMTYWVEEILTKMILQKKQFFC